MIGRLTAAVAGSLVLLIMLALPAAAEDAPVGGDLPDPTPEASLDDEELEGGLAGPGGAAGGATPVRVEVDKTPETSQFYWEASLTNGAVCGDDGGTYERGAAGSSVDGEMPDGVGLDEQRKAYVSQMRDRGTHSPVGEPRVVCVGPRQAVRAPPPPPTAAEVWAAVPLPEPVHGISPGGDGLTGLDTWLWYAGDTSAVSLPAQTLRGYTLTATAEPVAFRWRMEDRPEGFYESATPGSEEDPAAIHVYQSKGDYEVVVEVAWQGTFRFSGYGISGGGPLGEVTVAESRPYHVVEIRGVRR